MLRNLKRMLDDEEGMSTITTYMMEIAACTSPRAWVVGLPFLYLILIPFAAVLDIVFCPCEVLISCCSLKIMGILSAILAPEPTKELITNIVRNITGE
jgi:hypothetical protein